MDAHDALSPSQANQKRLTLVLIGTSVFLLAEVVGGLLSNSLALLADAGHMLTDVGGLALALMALRFAARPATPERTYGFYRAEILAALTNAVVLIGISIFILIEAIRRFMSPPEVLGGWMLGVSLVGLIVNLVGIMILRSGSTQSLNMMGAYFEVLSDALSSLGVIIAGLIVWTTGWLYADPIISVGIGLFILPRTWQLLKEATGVLLEGVPADLNVAAIRSAITGLPGVSGAHDLHVWSLTSGVNALSVHVVLAEGASLGAILQSVHEAIKATFPIEHLTVQVEPVGWETSGTHL